MAQAAVFDFKSLSCQTLAADQSQPQALLFKLRALECSDLLELFFSIRLELSRFWASVPALAVRLPSSHIGEQYPYNALFSSSVICSTSEFSESARCAFRAASVLSAVRASVIDWAALAG